MKKNISLLLTLFLCVATLSAQQVDTITIHSKMGHDLKNVIILPESYTHSDTRYPVVYLLHGCGDNYSAWLKIKPELPQIASLYNFIIVCPDGKINSWYWNSPRNKDMQFEGKSHFRTQYGRSWSHVECNPSPRRFRSRRQHQRRSRYPPFPYELENERPVGRIRSQ